MLRIAGYLVLRIAYVSDGTQDHLSQFSSTVSPFKKQLASVDIWLVVIHFFIFFFKSGDAMLQKTRQQSNVPGRVPWPRPSDCLTREGKDSLLSTGSGAGDLSTHRTSDVQSGLCKDWRLIRMTQYEQSSHTEGKS